MSQFLDGKGIFCNRQHLVQRKWFFQKIKGSELYGPDCHVHIGMA